MKGRLLFALLFGVFLLAYADWKGSGCAAFGRSVLGTVGGLGTSAFSFVLPSYPYNLW